MQQTTASIFADWTGDRLRAPIWQVLFTNESNIDRWVNSRQKAIDSKIGRLEGLHSKCGVPMLVRLLPPGAFVRLSRLRRTFTLPDLCRLTRSTGARLIVTVVAPYRDHVSKSGTLGCVRKGFDWLQAPSMMKLLRISFRLVYLWFLSTSANILRSKSQYLLICAWLLFVASSMGGGSVHLTSFQPRIDKDKIQDKTGKDRMPFQNARLDIPAGVHLVRQERHSGRLPKTVPGNVGRLRAGV